MRALTKFSRKRLLDFGGGDIHFTVADFDSQSASWDRRTNRRSKGGNARSAPKCRNTLTDKLAVHWRKCQKPATLPRFGWEWRMAKVGPAWSKICRTDKE